MPIGRPPLLHAPDLPAGGPPAIAPTDDPDVQLMLAFQAGSVPAFETLVRRHQQRVHGLVCRLLPGSADADDLVQEVFLRVYRHAAGYEPTAKFTTWLHRITVNVSLNAMRRGRQRALSLDAGDATTESAAPRVADDTAPPPESALASEELRSVVQECLDALPAQQRLALVLNKYEDLSYEQMSAVMDLTVPAVKSLLSRARQNVKEALQRYLQRGIRPAAARVTGLDADPE